MGRATKGQGRARGLLTTEGHGEPPRCERASALAKTSSLFGLCGPPWRSVVNNKGASGFRVGRAVRGGLFTTEGHGEPRRGRETQTGGTTQADSPDAWGHLAISSVLEPEPDVLRHEDLTSAILGAAIEVHSQLGPGML